MIILVILFKLIEIASANNNNNDVSQCVSSVRNNFKPLTEERISYICDQSPCPKVQLLFSAVALNNFPSDTRGTICFTSSVAEYRLSSIKCITLDPSTSPNAITRDPRSNITVNPSYFADVLIGFLVFSSDFCNLPILNPAFTIGVSTLIPNANFTLLSLIKWHWSAVAYQVASLDYNNFDILGPTCAGYPRAQTDCQIKGILSDNITKGFNQCSYSSSAFCIAQNSVITPTVITSTLQRKLSEVAIIPAIEKSSACITIPVIRNSSKYMIQRCFNKYMNDNIISGFYIITTISNVLSNFLIVTGRIKGKYIQNFVQERKNNAIYLHFKLPSISSYTAFVEVLFDDYKRLAQKPLCFNRCMMTDKFDSSLVTQDTYDYIAEERKKPLCRFVHDSLVSDYKFNYWRMDESVVDPSAVPDYKWITRRITPRQLLGIENATVHFHHCRLHGAENRKRSLQLNRKICIIGDSHSRYLTAAIVNIQNNSSELSVFPIEGGHNFSYFNFNGIREKSFEPFVDELLTHTCHAIVANVGQWQLSRYTYGKPFSLVKHGEYIHALISYFEHKQYDMRRFVWLSIHSMGEHSYVYDCFNRFDKFDYRNSYNLELYRDVDLEVARQRGVGSLDVLTLQEALRDTSFDQCHFKSPVGRETAFVVMSYLHDVMVEVDSVSDAN